MLKEASVKMGDSNQWDESEMLRRLSAGDESAFRQVYDRYWKGVFRAARRYLRSDDLAQDVVQEVFSSVWHRRDTFEHILNLESYLITIAHNHTYRELKKWASESKHQQAYAALLDVSADNVDHALLEEQYEKLLEEAIDLLPPQQKLVFRLAKVEGLTHEAIARRLNLSQGTVKNHMVRALQFLRQYLGPHVAGFFIFLFL